MAEFSVAAAVAAAPEAALQPEPADPTAVEEQEEEIPEFSLKDKVGFYLFLRHLSAGYSVPLAHLVPLAGFITRL